MPKQIQYIKNGDVVAQLDEAINFNLPDHDTTNEVWIVPEQVTLWQIRGVLAAMGLEDTITTVVNSMPDSNEKKIALRAWEYANNIRRQSPTVTAIKAILNLTDEQTDQIFIQAEQIDA